MQFYLNGFYFGDPAYAPTDVDALRQPLHQVEQVDVLIVGSGPAGLVLAAQLAQFPDVDARIVERRDGPLQRGQADGVACRTVEMFEAFGLSERLLAESYWVNELTFWSPDPHDKRRIIRTGRTLDTEPGISEFPHVILNQARMHDHLLGAMERAPGRLTPDYGITFEGLEVKDDGHHPVQVRLRRGDESFSLNARYVVGCDGAHSAVRSAIGREMYGDAANHAWGVIDALCVTDFPDIRLKSTIQSEHGSVILIPREGGYLIRMYVDLGEVTDANRERLRAMTGEDIADAIRAVLHPYTFEVIESPWSSVYEIAQRLTDAFDDAAGPGGRPRVFIAGDACHTHSAKAGQGMNVSMQDAFNLGWKLAAVLEGRSDASLLATYSQERQPLAQELIDFDIEWSTMLAAPPLDPEHPELGGIDPDELQNYFTRAGRYTAGVAARYRPALLTGDGTYQELAAGFEIGARLHSAPVIRIADARAVQLGHAARADGRWRLYAFAGADEATLYELCEWLTGDPESPVQRFTARGGDVDSVIDVRGVLQRPHREIELHELPQLLRPRKGKLGLTDYEKAFTIDPAADIYALREIDRTRGCVVLTRPDQFVAQVLPLDAYAEIAAFFGAFMLPAESR